MCQFNTEYAFLPLGANVPFYKLFSELLMMTELGKDTLILNHLFLGLALPWDTVPVCEGLVVHY